MLQNEFDSEYVKPVSQSESARRALLEAQDFEMAQRLVDGGSTGQGLNEQQHTIDKHPDELFAYELAQEEADSLYQSVAQKKSLEDLDRALAAALQEQEVAEETRHERKKGQKSKENIVFRKAILCDKDGTLRTEDGEWDEDDRAHFTLVADKFLAVFNAGSGHRVTKGVLFFFTFLCGPCAGISNAESIVVEYVVNTELSEKFHAKAEEFRSQKKDDNEVRNCWPSCLPNPSNIQYR